MTEAGTLERKYAALYEGMPVMMHSIDRRGRLVRVSDQWLRTMGYSRREVLGRKSTDFLTKESARYAREVILPAYFKTGSCRDVPYQMVKKNGEIIDVLLSAGAERGPEGDVERSLAVLVDVTARKREQDELVRTKAWFEGMFDSSPDAIASTTAEGRFVRVNKAFERLTGYSRRELLAKTFLDITVPEDVPAGRRVIAGLSRGGGASAFEKQYVRKDGSRVSVHITAFPVKDPEGRNIGFAAIIKDLTEMRRAQAERAEAQAWFRAFVASSRDTIQSVARDGRMLDFNPAFERLTGYSRAELLRMRFQQLTPREYHALDEAAFRRLAAGEPSAEFEKEYVRKDGTRVPVALTTFSVRGEDGAVLGYAAIIRDISERKRLEREILESGAREQSRLGRELHDSVGQDLTGVSLMARTLARRLETRGGREAEQARLIADSSARAVEQVRALAAGLLPSELLPDGLPPALRELAGRVEKVFGLACAVRSPRSLPRLPDVALVHLYRIAQESLTNAAKHARARRALVELSVKARTLELRVLDDGAGIGQGAEGDGMGLKIMRHRASMLGGALDVRPGKRRGTVVVCSVPLFRR